jgi:hypothetical protein
MNKPTRNSLDKMFWSLYRTESSFCCHYFIPLVKFTSSEGLKRPSFQLASTSRIKNLCNTFHHLHSALTSLK